MATIFEPKETHTRIQTEIAATHVAVEAQDTPSEKQAALSKAFIETELPQVKKHLIEMAEAVGGPELEPFLLGVLQNEADVRLRILAVKALAKHGSADSIQPLLKCAENDPEGLDGWDCMRGRTTARRDAYFALAEIGLREPAASPRIAAAVAALPVTADDLHDPKNQVLFILTQDKELLKPFLERLRDEDPKVSERGVIAFRFLKLTQAPKELVELLGDSSPDGQSWVALVLGEIVDPNTIPILIEAATTTDRDRRVRCNAIGSLGDMRATQAEPILRDLLADESVNVIAAIALSHITGERHPLVPEGYNLD